MVMTVFKNVIFLAELNSRNKKGKKLEIKLKTASIVGYIPS